MTSSIYIKRFDMSESYYVDQEDNKASYRAQQIYLILLGVAYNRQTITYGPVANLLNYEGSGTLARLLGKIMRWCEENNLQH